MLETAIFVAVWLALGLALHLDANTYLLLGLPLTLFFQRVVRGKPITAMWVRDPERSGSRLRFVVAAAGLQVYPVVRLVTLLVSKKHLSPLTLAVSLVACAGAVAGAYAISHFDRKAARQLLICFLTAGVIGLAEQFSVLLLPQKAFALAPHGWLLGLQSLLFYLPYAFLIEENSFRGVLDAHVHHAGERHGLWSAAYVSCLWGAWHYPIVGHGKLLVIPFLALGSCLVGIPLSLSWRKSGNLAVPVAVHAFIDAVRNGLGHMPH